MINELFQLTKALDQANITVEHTHSKYKMIPKVTKKAPCVQIILEDRQLYKIKSIAAEQAAEIRKYGKMCIRDRFHSDVPALWEKDNLDVAEIHSQGLELLFFPYADELFGEGGEAFQYYTVLNVLYVVTQGFLYDEFQNMIYASPDMTLDNMNHLFYQLSQEYGEQYSLQEHEEQKGYQWVDVSHTFQTPFYYISYATSGLSALDIWELSGRDRQAAVNKYCLLYTSLFILCGIACIVETVMMLRGKDFLLFWGYPDREKEFDLPALCKAEWWLFAIDGVLCLIIGGASPVSYTHLL